MSTAFESNEETDDEIEHLGQEFVDQLRTKEDPNEPVDLNYLVEHTSAEDIREAKSAIRVLSDNGWITTTPDWEYKLAGQRL